MSKLSRKPKEVPDVAEDMAKLRAYQCENFAVKVEQASQLGPALESDEVSLQITHNSRQWTNSTMYVHEIPFVIEALARAWVNYFRQ